jgi:predicted DNA-binding ribbon-helix-helix protein
MRGSYEHLEAFDCSFRLYDNHHSRGQAIAKTQGKTISQLIIKINDESDLGNLCSAIRMFVLRYYRDEWLDIKHSIH